MTRKWENQVKTASAIAQALCQVGQLDQCQQVTEAMGDPYWKAFTLSKMAQIVAQTFRKDVALDMATRAATVAETIPEDALLDNSRAVLLQCEIAQTLAKLGDVMRTWDTALKAMRRNRSGSSQVIRSVAQALMLAGDKVYLLVLLAEVVQRAKDDFDVNFQLDILRVVVEALVEAGYLEEAQQLRLELNDEAITVPVVSPEKHIEEQEFSLRALQTELANTCFKGRDALFALLERSTFDLSAIDQGKTLWKIYTAMQQMNSWFGLPVKAAPQLSQ